MRAFVVLGECPRAHALKARRAQAISGAMSGATFAPATPLTIAGLLAAAARSVYQPVVRLPERRVVAYEALARGPVGSALESPAALFSAAAAEGLVPELDQAGVPDGGGRRRAGRWPRSCDSVACQRRA
jgi:EAL domain-containing protein (putative c-di-GMP-specific phosphodiesterase class I)